MHYAPVEPYILLAPPPNDLSRKVAFDHSGLTVVRAPRSLTPQAARFRGRFIHSRGSTTRSLLRHHEIAILILLLNAPGQVARSDPDAIALHQANFVEIVSAVTGDDGFGLTPAGMELLRRLGMTTG